MGQDPLLLTRLQVRMPRAAVPVCLVIRPYKVVPSHAVSELCCGAVSESSGQTLRNGMLLKCTLCLLINHAARTLKAAHVGPKVDTFALLLRIDSAAAEGGHGRLGSR